jgi:TIR domain
VAFVPGFEHDVFVSYAHIDNERGGWVTKFVKELEVRLAERLGGNPRPSVWIDHKLSGNETLQQILDAIQKAAALLLVHSPSYLRSKWCRDELLSFVATQNSQGNRVFVVRTGPHARDLEHPGLRDLPGYEFWMMNASGIAVQLGMPEAGGKGRRYAAELTRLAVQLAETLQKAAPRDASTPRGATMPRVFLAELPDDALESKRTEVEEALRQALIEVIPRDPKLVANLAEFETWVRGILPSCGAFVQLLNANSGKTRASPKGLPALQFQLASQAGIERLIQWREAGLILDFVPNDEHRSLLQHPSVRTGGLQELISEIIKVATAKEASLHIAESATPSVLVNSDLCDRELGKRVEQTLNDKGLKAELPPADTKPRDMRHFLLERLLSWDATFIVHRESQWGWVNEQLNQVFEKNLLRGKLTPPRSPAIVGLLKARKTDGEPLDTDLEDLATYEVGEDIDDGELSAVMERFVQRLRSNGPRAL